MKILYFTNILAPYRIGLFNKLNEIFNGDIKFYFDGKTEINRKWKIPEAELKFRYEINNAPYISTVSYSVNKSELQRFIYFPFYIFKIVLREKPEIILTSEFGLRTLFALIAGKLVGAKTFILSEVTSQSESNINFIRSHIRKFLAKLSDGGIAFGRKSAGYLLSLGFSQNDIVISPEAIDNSYFEKLSGNITKKNARAKLDIPNDKFVFLYVGQFIQRKGLDLYLKAIDRFLSGINSGDVLFLFAGGNENEFKKVTGIKPYDNFKIIDYVQSDRLVDIYKASDCLILPTRNDVWGLVVNEAVACGLPVAVSEFAGSAGDLIQDKQSGLVFNPFDEISFAEVLEFCFVNRTQLERFAINAKSKLEFFNHETAAKRIKEFVTNH